MRPFERTDGKADGLRETEGARRLVLQRGDGTELTLVHHDQRLVTLREGREPLVQGFDSERDAVQHLERVSFLMQKEGYRQARVEEVTADEVDAVPDASAASPG